MGEQQSTDLVITALDMAATTRGAFPTGVVLHADRGTQFTSQKLAAYMRAVKGRVSMGRAGGVFNCLCIRLLFERIDA